MATFTKEEVSEVKHWTDTLFSFKTSRNRSLRFKNGHFLMIGLEIKEKPLLRAYSVVSPNYVDYLEGKITDRDLLYDVYGTELEDSDCIDLEQKTKSYQIGDVIASIENVNSITEEHLEIVRRYV